MEKSSHKATEGKKLPKPNNVIAVPTSYDGDFFRWWCIILRPFVKLSDKEIDVLACYLKHRLELSSQITNQALLDSVLMSNEVRNKIIEECKITLKYYYVVMHGFKKRGIIKGKAINPRLIPNVRPDDNGVFQLLILFKDKQKK